MIASVVIGGTSLFGGIGTIYGTVVQFNLDRRSDQQLVLMNVIPVNNNDWLILVAVVAFDQFAKSGA